MRVTPKVLDTLKAHQAKATFFVVGRNVTSRTQGLLKRMVEEGHRLGTHTESHRFLAKNLQRGEISKDQALSEILDPIRKLQAMQVPVTEDFRSPYGAIWVEFSDPQLQARSQELAEVLSENQLRHVGWDINSADYHAMLRPQNPEAILRQICREKGGVILLHDIQPWTGENLGSILEAIRCSGHKFVGMNEIERENARRQKNGERGFVSMSPIARMCGETAAEREFHFSHECVAGTDAVQSSEGVQ